MSDSNFTPDSDPLNLRRIQRERRTRIVIAVVVFALVVCIPLVLFRMTAFKLEIAPQKADENVRVSTQDGMAMALGKRVLLFGESTKLIVESEGFHPYESQLERTLKERVLPIMMDPLPGVITVQVQAPSDVLIEIRDSEVRGSPPLTTELERGIYEVLVTGEQIVPLRHEFQVEGYGQTQEIRLVAEESVASMVVRVEPSIATIAIDGTPIGQGSYDGRIAVGDREISFMAEGYLPHRLNVSVDVDERVDLGVVELHPKPANLDIASIPSDASILIDGKFVGSTPSRVTIGANKPIEIEIRKPNFETQTANVEMRPGQSGARSFSLEPVTIHANVNATPQATVWVNGERRGQTPSSVEVNVGDVVKVTREGFATQSEEILATGPNRRTLDFKLIDELQDKYDKAPKLLVVAGSLELRKVPPLQVKTRIPEDVSGSSEPSARDFELTRAFYLGTYEVRRKEFAKFATSLKVEPSDENLPISEISWSEAARFCNWLSSQENLEPVYIFQPNGKVTIDSDSLGFRLPTEAEWEAAAQFDVNRKTVVGPYPWGNGDAPRTGSGNYSGRESRQEMHPFLDVHLDNHAEVAPVGSYRQNANGFHDLGGNVAEWVQDFYESKSQGLNRKLIDPLGPQSGLDRMVKGANFRTHDLQDMYINSRKVVGHKDETVGFRVAKWIW